MGSRLRLPVSLARLAVAAAPEEEEPLEMRA